MQGRLVAAAGEPSIAGFGERGRSKMNDQPDNFSSRGEGREGSRGEGRDGSRGAGRARDAHALPEDLGDLGRLLDARGETQRGGLSTDALERIASMSDLQLPMSGQEGPMVIARIGPARAGATRFWRIAAGIAVVAGLGVAAVLISRGFGGGAPAPGTLVDGGSSGGAPVVESPQSPERGVVAPKSTRTIAAEHLERALAATAAVPAKAASASAVVVALSGASSAAGHDASLHFPDLDEALAADIAPLFQAGSLLDGSGMTYEDLSSEVAAIVGPGSFR
jgi:hypothetical protein